MILPLYSIYQLQPLDISVFQPLVIVYSKQLTSLIHSSLGLVSMSNLLEILQILQSKQISINWTARSRILSPQVNRSMSLSTISWGVSGCLEQSMLLHCQRCLGSHQLRGEAMMRKGRMILSKCKLMILGDLDKEWDREEALEVCIW